MKYVVLVLSLGLLIMGCGKKETAPDQVADAQPVSEMAAEETVPAPPASGQTVLLVYEETPFKNALINAMEKDLTAAGLQIAKKMHSKSEFDGGSAGDYNAVFITNSGVNSKVRPWIAEWLQANEQYKSRILLHTTQTSNWKVNANVDVVTSASSVEEAETLAQEYMKKINLILKTDEQ